MPRDGRIPKPTALKLLEGNPGHRPLNRSEPKPRPIAPKCPTWLDADAKREWRRVAPELERLGLLTGIDMAALAAYCQSYSEWKRYTAVIEKEGSTFTTDTGQIRARPEVAMGRKALADVRAWAIEFGLTPSARARMQITDPGFDDDDDDSPFDV
jgi:P27 family predicted phage terminase small subunit